MSHENPKEGGACSLCSGRYGGCGHSPVPLGSVEHRCCTECHSQLVTPARRVPRLFVERAAGLDCEIEVVRKRDVEEGVDYGPYRLCHAEGGHHVWLTGLPLEGIADALDRLERECAGEPNAWESFGEGWAHKYTANGNRDMTSDKAGVCPFCGGRYEGWGNNPAPLVGGRCCDECNLALVVPVRRQLLRHQLKHSAQPRAESRPHKARPNGDADER
jgi:hypothetical protein